MAARQPTTGWGEQYSPTVLQTAMGDPLRSEQRANEFLPRTLSRLDLLALFIAIVLFIPNASIVQATQGAGPMTYLYWVVGTFTFLIPGAVVTGQLNRFMPVDGSIYVWTHRALGSLWGFFAGFCAWFPGILVLLAAGDTIISLFQAIGTELFGPATNWLTEPWQQGLIILGILILTNWLATFPLSMIMKVMKIVIPLYLLAILSIGLAGVIWLLHGHGPQVSLTTIHLQSGISRFVLYGVIILALLGVEVPLNMAAETKTKHAATLFLRWGPWIVLAAYLLGTFGVMVVVPPATASLNFSSLSAVSMVFGPAASIATNVVFILFFLVVALAYHITFARILFVSALDHRLPTWLAQVNRHRAPARAILTQTFIVGGIVTLAYFIGPIFYPGEASNFSLKVYNVSQGTTTIIWCISMVILFLDLPVLLIRFKTLLNKRHDQLIAPHWVLYACSIVGGIASCIAIWVTLAASWNPTLIPDSQWWIIIGGCVLFCLVIGLLGAAYPRLLSSLDEQTAAARENARLYSELSAAYARLRELDQLKDTFLATASHELRTPLTIMQGYLELLSEMNDDEIDAQTRRAFMNKARRACDELVLLQANIMDASQIEFDTSNLHRTAIPLKDLCLSVIELFEPLIVQEKRRLEVNITDTIQVWVDESRLKQILRNLIANALRYSPHRTPVCLTAVLLPEEQTVRINVIDRGFGIPPDKQAAIFERFVRLERDMHGSVRGSGLGLAITRQLIEAMQGTITVQSSGIPGEGSIFSFTLPTPASAQPTPTNSPPPQD